MKHLLHQEWTSRVAAFALLLSSSAVAMQAEEKTVWEGSEAISWNTEVAPGTQFETPDGTFAGLAKDDIIKVYTTTTYDDPQYVVTYKAGDSWDWTDLSTSFSDGVISYTVESDQIATEIAERGLILRGQAWTATKITIGTAEDTPAAAAYTVWNGTPEAAGNWAHAVQIEVSAFADANVSNGDVLRIHLTDIQKDGDETVPQVVLAYSDAEWSWTDFSTTYGYYDFAPSVAYCDIAVTGELLSALTAAGGEQALLIRGKNYTATKVEIIKAESYFINLSDQYTALYLAGTADVNITRHLLAGFNTITLPFAATAKELTGSDDAYLAQLSSASTDDATVLTFTKVDAAEPNKPYLIYVASDVDVLAQTGKTVSALVDNWNNQAWGGDFCMQGNYAPAFSVYNAGSKPCYVVSGEDSIAPTGSAATIDGMRAYIYDNSGSAVKAGMTFRVGDTETAIQAIDGVPTGSAIYFNLSGQRTQQPTKGIYIVGGHKVAL